MSRRTPWELIWVEHSKPAIQKEWKRSGIAAYLPPQRRGDAEANAEKIETLRQELVSRRFSPRLCVSAGGHTPRLSGFIAGVVVFVGDYVLLALGVHQAFAPLPFELVVLGVLRAS